MYTYSHSRAGIHFQYVNTNLGHFMCNDVRQTHRKSCVTKNLKAFSCKMAGYPRTGGVKCSQLASILGALCE